MRNPFIEKIHATTILTVRRNGEVAVAGDGQVSMGDTVMKNKAKKIRSMYDGAILAGFAGTSADALTLFDKFEAKLDEYNGKLIRSAVELAKEWRTDKMLRHLEALLLVCDLETTLLISGTGDVIEPDDGIIAIGSGGHFAQAAAKALYKHSTLSAGEIVMEAMKIAADICVFTNHEITMDVLSEEKLKQEAKTK